MAEVNTVAPEVAAPTVTPDLSTKVATPEVKTEVVAQSNVEPAVEQDLMKRVSAFKPTPKSTEANVEDIKFDVNDINKIEDPKAKEYAEKAYKSFQKGFNQKFQEIAEIRKSLESEKSKFSNWTPERIQQLLNDKQFVEAAQKVAGVGNPQGSGLTNEEYSALSEPEKAKLNQMEQKITYLESINEQSLKIQQDEKLRTKYPDYAPDIVDTTIKNLTTGQVQATREDIWKIVNFDNYMNRAYALGRRDKMQDNSEKMSSSTFEGMSAVPNKETPIPEKGETDRSFFRRLVMNNYNKSKMK